MSIKIATGKILLSEVDSMTYHFFSCDTHQCSQCEAFFLPFEQGLPCPRCGEPATEFHDFLAEAIAGLTIHKRQYGRFSPGAFFVGGFAEHVFLLLCNSLDAIDGAANFEEAMRRHLDDCEWGDQQYLRSHVYDIAVRIDKKLREKTGAGSEFDS